MDIPKPKDNFLRRNRLLSEISNILSNQTEIKFAVIIGGGGSGKTTVAREVQSFLRTRVSWEINAETTDSMYNSFWDLAAHLAINKQLNDKLESIKEFLI